MKKGEYFKQRKNKTIENKKLSAGILILIIFIKLDLKKLFLKILIILPLAIWSLIVKTEYKIKYKTLLNLHLNKCNVFLKLWQ